MAKRIGALSAALVFILAACSGGTRPELDDPSVATDPAPVVTPEPDQPDDDTEAADTDPADDEQAVEVAPTATPSADDSDADPVETPDDAPTTAPDIAPPDPSLYPLQGTVTVSLADGRTFEAPVGCGYENAGDAWEFRFGGESSEGVQIEGAYDNTQPDFAILFLAGADSLNGDDVLLSNLNGGDDVRSTSDGGSEWVANIELWTPEGASVNADLTATCG